MQGEIARAGSQNFASLQAEQCVISRMISHGEEAEAHIGDLSETDFYYPENGKLYRSIQAVVAKRMHVDLITVDSVFSELFPMEQKVLAKAMAEAMQMQIRAFRNLDDYITIVKSLSERRQSIRRFESIATSLRDPTQDVASVLASMEAEDSVSRGRGKWESLQDVLMATYGYLERRQAGQIKSITTGLACIDAMIGGFFDGELTVIGARPSVGKSAFGANIALAAAKKGFRVGIVSREMTDIQYGARMLSHEAWINGMKMRKGDINGDDWASLAEGMTILGGLPLDFLFSGGTVEDLAIDVRRRVKRNELDLLIVDYLQLMETSSKYQQEHLRVGHISTTLKHLATDCNIPVVALAQVNRDTDGQMPTLKSLKASGDIEQDADGVIFLHRPSSPDDPYVDPKDRPHFATFAEKGFTYICIGVAKQRQGTIGRATVLFDAAHMRYLEIDRREG